MVLDYINSSTAKAQRGTTFSAQHIRREGVLRQKKCTKQASVILPEFVLMVKVSSVFAFLRAVFAFLRANFGS